MPIGDRHYDCARARLNLKAYHLLRDEGLDSFLFMFVLRENPCRSSSLTGAPASAEQLRSDRFTNRLPNGVRTLRLRDPSCLDTVFSGNLPRRFWILFASARRLDVRMKPPRIHAYSRKAGWGTRWTSRGLETPPGLSPSTQIPATIPDVLPRRRWLPPLPIFQPTRCVLTRGLFFLRTARLRELRCRAVADAPRIAKSPVVSRPG